MPKYTPKPTPAPTTTNTAKATSATLPHNGNDFAAVALMERKHTGRDLSGRENEKGGTYGTEDTSGNDDTFTLTCRGVAVVVALLELGFVLPWMFCRV